MKRTFALMCGLAASLMPSSALAVAGPYTFIGRGGGMDWERWHYGPVRDDEVQQISFQLLTGGAALDPDMHWAFGLRGASWDGTYATVDRWESQAFRRSRAELRSRLSAA